VTICAGRKVNNMFIDYTQAFDSVKRNKVLECLIQYNISAAKLQKLIALTQEQMQ
jgi:hypothetical protein